MPIERHVQRSQAGRSNIRSQFYFLIVVAIVTHSTSARAELWQNADLALVDDLSVGAGYDSNLNLSAHPIGSAFVDATPEIILRQPGSVTDFQIGAKTLVTTFQQHAGTEIDPAFYITYAPSENFDIDPAYAGDGEWKKVTAGNAFLNRRVTSRVTHAEGSFRLMDTGKSSLQLSALYNREAFEEADLDTNQSFEAKCA